MTYKRRRIATIDIGTNSVLMLVAERNEEGRVSILADESHVTRLGENLRKNKRISDQALQRTVEAVKEFAETAKKLEATEIFVVATNAAREAENKDQFLSEIQKITDGKVEIIPANEEARLTYISVTSDKQGDAPSMVVDIGGGSTEITWGIGHRFDGGRSLDLGVVKLLESYLKDDPPSESQIAEAQKEIDQRLRRVTPLSKLEHYYGTAGSFTHIASVQMKLEEYDPKKIDGFKLTHEIVKEWMNRLKPMSKEERLTLPGIDPRRVDVIFAGCLITERLYSKFQTDAFEVYDRGVRFGKFYDTVRKFLT